MNILVLDPGSSSLKFALFAIGSEPARPARQESRINLIADGAIERIGSASATVRLMRAGEQDERSNISAHSPAECLPHILERLVLNGATNVLNAHSSRPAADPLAAVACRVVHGGDRFMGTTRMSAGEIEAVRALAPLAPLHNPPAADLMTACLNQLPGVALYAVFDTAFHRTMPDVANTYALPHKLCEEHSLHRFGFHGIAHKCVSGKLRHELGGSERASRIITCHLGSGASICAVLDGESIDTSMGMTSLEGLVMGTRCGDIDAGLLLYLMQTAGLPASRLREILENESGLLGVSGLSSDLRDLEEAERAGNNLAKLAIDLFAYRAAKTVGSYCAALGGVDGLAFSGGIGEHSPAMRAKICGRLAFLGLSLQDALNAAVTDGKSACISSVGSTVPVWVIPADENRQIAREVVELV